MVNFKKTPKPAEKEEKAPKVETPQTAAPVATCACGEPVALELGQNAVCAKHMRTS